MIVLLSLDVAFLQYAIAHTLKAGPSVLLLFGFEYVILASRVVTTGVKYLIYAVDGWLDGRWDNKGTYVFYLDLVTDLLHLFVYLVFFLIDSSSSGERDDSCTYDQVFPDVTSVSLI